jgi:hypothetical protein
MANFKTCSQRLLPVEHVMLVRSYYQGAKPGVIYKSSDEHTGQPAENLCNSVRGENFNHTTYDLTVPVH